MHSVRFALRRLRRSPGFTLLNVSGLAVGLAVALLALFYIRDEMRVDRFHEDADRIVGIVLADSLGQNPGTTLSYPVGLTVADQPGVESVVRVAERAKQRLRVPGDEREVNAQIVVTEAEFFSMFSFPLLSGPATGVLDDPSSLVLTSQTASALFGDADPVGQTVEYLQRSRGAADTWTPLTVTGVTPAPPPHSTLQFEAVTRFEVLNSSAYGDPSSWNSFWLSTYARLAPGVDPQAFSDRIAGPLEEADPADRASSDFGAQFYGAVPIPDLYFLSGEGTTFTGQSVFMRLFGLIALAVLIIAILNYVNLATARGADRAREIGMRKAVGAGQGQVMRQIVGEALGLVALAFVGAVGIVLLALPLLNTFFGKEIALGWDAAPVWAASFVLMATVGVLAGLYPAVVLSRFAPSRVLRSSRTTTGTAAWLRRGLVVTQFAATIGLLVFTGFVFRQLDHVKSEYLLPDDARIAFLDVPDGYATRTTLLKAALSDLPGVRATAAGDGVPGQMFGGFGFMYEGEPLMAAAVFGDRDYLDVIRMPMTAQAERAASDDPFRLFVNEAFMDALNAEWTPDVRAPFGLLMNGIRSSESSPIAGEMRNVPMGSLRNPIGPLFFGEAPDTSDFRYLVVEVERESVAAFQAELRAIWPNYSDTPPDVGFVDDFVDRIYEAETQLAQLVTLLALVALFIACLGLFGLAAHAAQSRRKEVSIRKVLGAGVASLVGRLSREFALLIVAAFVLAAPVAYLVTRRWLEGFTARTDISPTVFALVLASTLLLALATVSYHAWTAATRNPADVLRDE